MEYIDEEEAAILAKKREELRKLIERKKLEERRRQEELARETILRAILTEEARERLARLKLVRPELARTVEDQLIVLAQSGRLRRPLTDEELKEILKQISQTTSRRGGSIKIKRKSEVL